MSLIKKSQILIFQNIEINEAIFQTFEFIKSINQRIKFIAVGHDYERELNDVLFFSDVFIDAKTNFNTLLLAIDKLISEGVFIDSKAANYYINILNKPKKSNEHHLTKRETEILELICNEKTSKEIATILEISNRTVENHRKNLLFKTKSKGTAGLIKYALKNNIYKL